MKHLIFFDARCPLCWQSVYHILRLDAKGLFFFSDLKGITATEKLRGPFKGLQEENSLLLFESVGKANEHLWMRGRAVFRIFWLLGGKWRLFGLLCFFPLVPDLAYRLLARLRHRFFKNRPFPTLTEEEKKRFLPYTQTT